MPLSCVSCLTDCVRLKCSIVPSLLNKITFWQQLCSKRTLLVTALNLSPFHFYSQPLFPAQMAAADGRVGVCLCVCEPQHRSTVPYYPCSPPVCMHACAVYTHTNTCKLYTQTERDVHTFRHQWGNPCLSGSSVLSVLLRLRSHCNSLWLLLCHSHIHACTVTNTLQLCENHCKGNPC